MSTTTTTTLQILSITTSLLSSGSIATLTLFSIPSLLSLPPSQSLPQIRWLFSRGSHIFPSAAAVSAAGFFGLAFSALPEGERGLRGWLEYAGRDRTVQGYWVAGALCLGIAPFTGVMIPVNFKLIKLNEELGGSRSARSAAQSQGSEGGGEERSASDSVAGKGEAEEFTDLSGPQTRTQREATEEEEREVQDLLVRFGRFNIVRALLIGGGGVVGLWTALKG